MSSVVDTYQHDRVDVKGKPVRQQTLLFATGTASSMGDNTMIAAPPSGQEIVVSSFQAQLESSTASVAIVKFGVTAKRRFRGVSDGDGFLRDYIPGREWRVGDATAFVLNLSVATQWGYSIEYYLANV